MALSAFDKYYQNWPQPDRQKDFDSFWNKAVAAVKKNPIEPVLKKNNKKSSHKFEVFEVSFYGYMKTLIKGQLYLPRNKIKPRVIVHIHDYNRKIEFSQQLFDNSMAYFFLTLRGHSLVNKLPEADDAETPGYMIENILDKDTYYVKAVFLDAFRSIDMLRLIPELDCSSIGILGKGFGASAALFTAVNSPRIKAVVLDSPTFCQLPLSQNIAENAAAKEINDFIASKKKDRKIIRSNMTYFDSINFSDKVSKPVLMVVGFKDKSAPPECSFGLFNRIASEKIMEIYPEEGNTAGGDAQFKKSAQWLIGKLSDI